MKLVTNVNNITEDFPSLYGNIKLPQVMRYRALFRRFCKSYSKKSCYFASSSGRVEIIGNHTDHEGGKVLACAVSLDILAAFLPNDSDRLVIKAENHSDMIVELSDIENKEKTSAGMIKGVLNYFVQHGYGIGGADVYMQSIVPTGAGISSSAAFELLFAEIENQLYNRGEISVEEIAKAGQYAENEYFLKPCGLLDQTAVAVGGVVLLDFFDGVKYEKIESGLGDLSLILIDTGGSHSHLTEHYAAIPKEMKAVAGFFGKDRLCDVNESEFYEKEKEITAKLGSRSALRAEHYFEEDKRVQDAVACLQNGDQKGFLGLINASGDSSRHKLQNCAVPNVSEHPIIDAVEKVKALCADAGVRVHGGGFAGTVLCLVPNNKKKQLVKALKKEYGEKQLFEVKARSRGVTVL